MEIEKLAIRDFLEGCDPMQQLAAEALDQLALALEIQYFRRGSEMMKTGALNNEVMLIRSGAIEVTTAEGELYGRYAAGDWIGYRSVINDQPVSLDVVAYEDTLVYLVPGAMFRQLMQQDARFNRYFSNRKPERLRGAIRDIQTSDYSLLSIYLGELAHPALTVSRETGIRATAIRMTEEDQRTALVADEHGLCGIVTDLDFRRRVIARGVDVEAPVEQIMSPVPHTLPEDAPASKAVLLMARYNFRHLPVLSKGGRDIVGVVSAADLLRSQSHHAVYLVGDISHAEDIPALKSLSQHLPQALLNMVRSSLPAYDIGHAVSSMGQAITRRLIELAEQQFGPPPVPYAFVAGGSMARREQTAHSDQDNGMILSDDYDAELHGDYFASIARFICAGLDTCGYIYCAGDIMAINDKWRQPLSVWRQYFEHWIEQPEPQALLDASIFFDLRCLYGEESLLTDLRRDILHKTQQASLFQAFMAGNALSFRPPLGIFKGFVLEKNGENEKVLDMKKRGVMPVIELARVYTLAQGIDELNTTERLQALADAPGGISDENIADLKDAFEFISTTRLEHQAMQIEAGIAPDNLVSPEQLSALERRHLKDAFAVVSDAQNRMTRRYQANRFR